MADKPISKLNVLDVALRRAYPTGMRQGLDVVIEKRTGFELFNTRPYHNYETWSDGYSACDGEFYVEAEDLDDCIEKLTALKTHTREPKPWDYVVPETAVRLGFPEPPNRRLA